MPVRLLGWSGNISEDKFEDIKSVDFDYKYPKNLDFRPGSELHQNILDLVMGKSQASYEAMKNRHVVWNELDRVMTAYIPEPSADSSDNSDRTRATKSVIIPSSYAILDTILSQMVTSYLNVPILRYRGTGPEDIIAAILLEKVIEIQNLNTKIGLSLHTLFRDAALYGFGVAFPSWVTQRGEVVENVKLSSSNSADVRIADLLGVDFESENERRLVKGVEWEGFNLEPIDPYMYLPDPSVPIDQPNRGEHVGFISPENYYSLLSREEDPYSKLFNVKYLGLDPVRGITQSTIRNFERDEKSGVGDENISNNRSLDVIYQVIKLIPSDYMLSDSDRPEIWIFAVASDNIVIMAHKSEYPYSDRFPIIVNCPEFDGHSISPISQIERTFGLQNFIDFLYSSHMANVERTVNNMIIYDPSVFNSKDMLNPAPGGRVRVRRKAWGKFKVQDYIMQMPANDFTRNNLNDAMLSIDLMFRGTTANDQMQGNIPQRTERVSARESFDTRKGILSRVNRTLTVTNLQTMVDLAIMTAKSTQWNMKKDVWVDLTGRWEKELKDEYPNADRNFVSPTDLVANINIVPNEPSRGLDDNPEAWQSMLNMALTQPELVKNIDGVRIYLHTLRLMGASNPNEFKRTTPIVVANDEEVLSAADSGDLVPASI